jgi:hypothetical protein
MPLCDLTDEQPLRGAEAVDDDRTHYASRALGSPTRPLRLGVGLSAARATRARRPARPTETGRPDRQPMRSDTGIMQAAALRGQIHPSA